MQNDTIDSRMKKGFRGHLALTNQRAAGLVGLLAVALLCAPIAWSQEAQGQSIKLGETDLYPEVRLEFLQNSNTFLSETDPTSATAFVIRPEAYWKAQRRLLELQGSYKGAYQASSEDAINYTDHTLKAEVEAEFTARKRAAASLSIDFGHDELGRNFTRGSAPEDSEQVEYVVTTLDSKYTYGASNARGNLSVGLRYGQRDYSNRRDLTAGSDFSYFEPYGQFSLRVSGDTRALFELRHRTFDSSTATKDRSDLSVLAGMQFAATGKTGGRIALGSTQSQYKSDSIDDASSLIVEGDLFWEPTSFSRFTLQLDRDLDGVGIGVSSIDVASAITDNARLLWDYQWSERLSHRTVLGIEQVNTDCPDRGSRTNNASLEVNLKVRRWLSVGASASSDETTIEDCPAVENSDLDYNRTRAGIFLRATL